jgi:hypothetical protein
VGECLSLIHAIDTIGLRTLLVAPDRALRGIRRDAKLPKVSCEITPPRPKRRLPYVQSLALLIDRLNDQMHMRVRLVGMQLCVAPHNFIYVELSFMWSD